MITEESPQMRALITQDVLKCLDTGEREAVKYAVPEAYALVENSLPFSYIPLECDMKIARSLWAILGGEACLRTTRAGTRSSLDGVVLRPIVDGSIRFFGISPRGLLIAAAKTMSATMRGIGKIVPVTTSPTGMDLEWSDIPDIVFTSGVWLDTFIASFESLFIFCKMAGSGRAVEMNRGKKMMTLRFSWEPAN